MIRKELHSVRRPFFDCSTYRRPSTQASTPVIDETLHLHAEMTRPLPSQTMCYAGIKVALKLAA